MYFATDSTSVYFPSSLTVKPDVSLATGKDNVNINHLTLIDAIDKRKN